MLGMIAGTVKVVPMLLLLGWFFSTLVKEEMRQFVREKLMVSTILLFVLGMMAPTVWIVYIALIALPSLMSKDRGEATAIYLISVLAIPSLDKPIAVGGIYILVFDKWVCAALGLGIAYFLRPIKGPRGGKWTDVSFWLLLILQLVQARNQTLTGTIRSLLDPLLTIALQYYVLSRCMNRAQDVTRFMLGMAFGAFVLSGIAMYEARSGWLIYKNMYHNLGLVENASAYTHVRSGFLRAATTFGEATSLGNFLAMAMVLMLAARNLFKNKRSWLIALGMIGVGLIAANTRSALIALGLGLLAYDLYRRHYAVFAMKAGLIGVAYAAMLVVAQVSPHVSEMMGLSGGSVGTADYRQDLLNAGIREIKKHPLAGVDITSALNNLADLRQGEGIVDFVNGYVFYGVTAGVPGVIALWMVFFWMAASLLVRRKRLASAPRLELYAAAAFGIALMQMLTCFTSGFGGHTSSLFTAVLAMSSSLYAIGARLPVKPRRARTVARSGADDAGAYGELAGGYQPA